MGRDGMVVNVSNRRGRLHAAVRALTSRGTYLVLKTSGMRTQASGKPDRGSGSELGRVSDQKSGLPAGFGWMDADNERLFGRTPW